MPAFQCSRRGNDGMSTQKHCIGQSMGWRNPGRKNMRWRPRRGFQDNVSRDIDVDAGSTSLLRSGVHKEGSAP